MGGITKEGFNMDTAYSFMDIIIVLSGVYILYNFYLLKFKGEIKETLLLPKDVQVKKCKDKAGYINEMAPKVLVLGIVVTICGFLGMLQTQKQLLGNWYLLVMAVFLAAIVWFVVASKKAVTKYWP